MRKIALLFVLFALGFSSCKRELTTSTYFVLPEEGSTLKQGHDLNLKLSAETGSFDSVRYLLDTTYLGTKIDTSSFRSKTDSLSLGIKVITARVFKNGEFKETTTNIVLLPAKDPVNYSFEVLHTFPHDTSSYTQGLEFHEGNFYESAGGNATDGIGISSLRKVEPTTGKVLKSLDMPENVFAEGLTLVDDKLIQLTWQNRIGIVYEKDSFKKVKEFPYQSSPEGWGLCFDGKRLYKSDGTNRIYFLNKDTYQEEGYIEVYDQNGAVNELNELEWIDGQLYANVYQKDRIVIIDPQTGAVVGDVNMSGLLPAKDHFENTDVLNGIAWDANGKRLFVTGKKWNTLFQIKLVEKK
ncbi:Glutamine cyclotransferase [Arcticibacter svalbardensis MN12-7]|uniref:Glutamine cyclotransferase n=1 Tax=Arcticibacter svalbardensis MN12-7 TaxID=1150600 RepID=R9GWF7_9SPHI|nr:glutaminyl-peptide cyclotransferase [Arcticibacter svalbardensis]EOR96003.1 Glutamine cyclotransferase [Arcticibacter svalbardensis MN12-7]